MQRSERGARLGSPGAGKARWLAAALVLAVLVLNGAGGGAASRPEEPATALSPVPSPTLTALPTVPAALTSAPARPTASARALLTPSPTHGPTPVPSPAPTATPSPSPTAVVASPTPVPTMALNQDVLHILLIGGDTGYVLDQNTDVLIVAAVNRKTKQVSLLSIPRDLWVYIPTVGYGRINTAHRWGARTKYPGFGPGLLIDTIAVNLGISIDHWVRVDYQGFVHAVDVLGGVDMVVACPTDLRYNGTNTTATSGELLQPGLYHMDGATALRYVRTRKGQTDFERARRQQQFLKAMWDQLKSPSIIPKIPGLWAAMKGNFATDLKLGEVLALAPLALDLQREDVRSRYIGPAETLPWTTPEGWEVLLPIVDKIQPIMASLDEPGPGGNNGLASEAARIQVRNGTARAQLAAIAADQLRWRGLAAVEGGPADSPDYAETQIVVLGDKPQTLELLVQLLKVKPKNVVRRADPDQVADLVVILGEDYDPCRGE